MFQLCMKKELHYNTAGMAANIIKPKIANIIKSLKSLTLHTETLHYYKEFCVEINCLRGWKKNWIKYLPY